MQRRQQISILVNNIQKSPHLKSRIIVPAEVLIADADEAPEGLHGRHVHQQEGSHGSLRLEVAHLRVQHRVSFQHREQFLLAGRVERILLISGHIKKYCFLVIRMCCRYFDVVEFCSNVFNKFTFWIQFSTSICPKLKRLLIFYNKNIFKNYKSVFFFYLPITRPY